MRQTRYTVVYTAMPVVVIGQVFQEGLEWTVSKFAFGANMLFGGVLHITHKS